MENVDAAVVIVCEPSGRWAAGLRRELPDKSVRLLETRLLDDAWQALAAAPAALVVAEYTPKIADGLLQRCRWLCRDFPQARLAIVAARRFASHRWLLHAAGAVHTVFSPCELGPLADMARRHAALIPPLPLTITERVWRSLPWGKTRPANSSTP